VEVSFDAHLRRGELEIEARVSTVDKTGVEMEALTAAGVAALTVYDMVKALEKGVTITNLHLVAKSGGKSGDWTRSRTRSRTAP
jgi:cyclic pyranopterin phosphate synthase